MVAVVRCNGSCANRPRINQYDGAKSCAIAASLYGGETGCSYGCLGCGDCGDCVEACQFDAIHMNPETGLPEVDEAKCTACGACVKACPKAIIEIRPQGKKSRRVYISCVNTVVVSVSRLVRSKPLRWRTTWLTSIRTSVNHVVSAWKFVRRTRLSS